MAHTDVAVVGGGVIGASIAYYLAEQGMRVTLFERGRAGGHASRASAGLLHPMVEPDLPESLRALSAASFDLFPGLVARLHELTGIDPGYQACGWLRVALREDEIPLLRARGAAGAYGQRFITGAEAQHLEPGLSPTVVAAIHAPHGAQVYAPALLQAYLHAAARLGAEVRSGLDVADLSLSDDRVTGIITADGEEIVAGHTVIAGGAWTARTAARLHIPIPVFPMRGQILALHAIPAPLRQVIFGGGVYLAAKAEGSVVVGATYEDVGFDDRLTAMGIHMLLAGAMTLAPSLAGATFRQTWVGLRPASRDGLPMLGAVPGWRDVSIATGHTAEGILLSPITGKLLAQQLRGDVPDLSLEPFSLARFTSV